MQKVEACALCCISFMEMIIELCLDVVEMSCDDGSDQFGCINLEKLSLLIVD